MGINSIGFQTGYVHKDCHLESLEVLASTTTWEKAIQQSRFQIDDEIRRIHIVFFGDSKIRNQYNFFRDHIAKPINYLNGKLELTYVEIMKFWGLTWPKSRETFQNLTRDHPTDHFVVIYNLGLHEIHNRGAIAGQRAGRVPSNPGPCIPPYQEDVGTMTELVLSAPALVRIWESSFAAWPNWGVYGVAWPPKGGQPFPLVPDTCNYMNQVAWDVVHDRYKIKVMDAYWLTLSRADHREVSDKETIRTSYKLVHMGPEVYWFLIRQISTITLEAIRKGETDKQYL